MDMQDPEATRPAGAPVHTHEEELLDSALEQTFPASDPVPAPQIS